MPTQNYITAFDIENIKIKQLYTANPTYIQTFIDSTNNWFEAYSLSLDVEIADIVFPVSQIVKDLILADLSVRVGKAHMSGSEAQSNPGDVYLAMYNLGMAEMNRTLPRVNELAISKGISRASDTVVFGRIIRS